MSGQTCRRCQQPDPPCGFSGPAQHWCRACWSAYQRARRARLALGKPPKSRGRPRGGIAEPRRGGSLVAVNYGGTGPFAPDRERRVAEYARRAAEREAREEPLFTPADRDDLPRAWSVPAGRVGRAS